MHDRWSLHAQRVPARARAAARAHGSCGRAARALAAALRPGCHRAHVRGAAPRRGRGRLGHLLAAGARHGLARPRHVERSEGTRLNSSHTVISYAVFCLKKKKKKQHKKLLYRKKSTKTDRTK